MQKGEQVKGLTFAQLIVGGKKQTGKAASGTYMLTAHRKANTLQIQLNGKGRSRTLL